MSIHLAAELPVPVYYMDSAIRSEDPDLGLSLHHFMPWFTTRQHVTSNREVWRPKALSGWNMLSLSLDK